MQENHELLELFAFTLRGVGFFLGNLLIRFEFALGVGFLAYSFVGQS